jgi:hypothetical protein
VASDGVSLLRSKRTPLTMIDELTHLAIQAGLGGLLNHRDVWGTIICPKIVFLWRRRDSLGEADREFVEMVERNGHPGNRKQEQKLLILYRKVKCAELAARDGR